MRLLHDFLDWLKDYDTMKKYDALKEQTTRIDAALSAMWTVFFGEGHQLDYTCEPVCNECYDSGSVVIKEQVCSCEGCGIVFYRKTPEWLRVWKDWWIPLNQRVLVMKKVKTEV